MRPMRSDADLERELEDWLGAEAAPMPEHRLRAVVDEFPRHTQVGRRTGLARSWGASLAAAAAAAVLLVVVVAGPGVWDRVGTLIGSGGQRTPPVWRAAEEFIRSAPNRRNPSPDSYGNAQVWGYLHSTDGDHEPAEYVAYPDFSGVGAKNWNDAGYVNLFVGRAPGEDRLTMHPWGGGDDIRSSIVAWTSPIAGSVTASGSVEVAGDCGDGTTFTIDRRHTTLESFSLPTGSRTFSVMTDVAIGDTLYFIVEPGADSNCDTTWLTLTISG
jgi:hypothetical protein